MLRRSGKTISNGGQGKTWSAQGQLKTRQGDSRELWFSRSHQHESKKEGDLIFKSRPNSKGAGDQTDNP